MALKRRNPLHWAAKHFPSFGRRFRRNSIIVLHTNTGSFSQEFNSSGVSGENAGSVFVWREDIAALTIQACFRGHLARRAYVALRSLVKLQALVRGVVVRRQSRVALQCMTLLSRLQITVRDHKLRILHKP